MTLGIFMLRGETVRCGCFGEDEEEAVKPLAFLARNGALTLLTVAGMHSRLLEFGMKEAVLANLMAVGIVCLYGLAHAHASMPGPGRPFPRGQGTSMIFDRPAGRT